MRPGPFFEPDPFKGILVPSLAGKRPKTDQNFNLYLRFPLRPLVSSGTQNYNNFVPVDGGTCARVPSTRRTQGRLGVPGLLSFVFRWFLFGFGRCQSGRASFGLGRFSTKLGPGTVANGSGLQKCYINQPQLPRETDSICIFFGRDDLWGL